LKGWRAVGHNFERDPPKDPPCQDWFNLFSKEKLYDLRSTDNGHYVMAKLTWPKAGELKAMIPLLFPDNSTMHVSVQFGSK
jgi:hypothetical protein